MATEIKSCSLAALSACARLRVVLEKGNFILKARGALIPIFTLAHTLFFFNILLLSVYFFSEPFRFSPRFPFA